MRRSNFTFNSVQLLYYKCHRNVADHIESPDWIRNKKAIINPINEDDKCFQYAATVVLDHEKIGKKPS